MYNVHPYISLKYLAKMCALYVAKYGIWCVYTYVFIYNTFTVNPNIVLLRKLVFLKS